MEIDTAKHIERLLSLLKAPVAGTTDSTTQFWEKYSEEAEEYDKDFLEKNRNNMESVLIFSGLFSAVAAGFLVSMQATLSPNPTDTTNAVIPPWEGPRSSDVWSQAIDYTGLSASLLAALGAVLGKQWLTDFTRLRRGPLQERGRRRQQKMDGLKKWQFEVVMGALPALIQLALLLFGIALSINLWHLNRTVGSVVIAATAVGGSLYLCFTIASLFSPSCPFHTPVSSTIQEAIAIVMKSLEETCQYWAWRSSDTVQKPLRISPVNKLLAYLPAFVALPLLALVSAVIATISIGPIILVIGIWWLQARRPDHRIGEDLDSLLYWFQCQFAASRRKFHRTACLVRDSARHVRDFIYRVYLDPQPDPQVSDSSSIAWLLETSNHPDFLMTAAMLVPDAKWPEDLDLSLPTQHLCNIFIRSISEKGYMHDQRDQSRQERDEAAANAMLSASHIQRLQGQLNAKSKKKESTRNVTVPGRVITTQEGRLEALKQKEAREAKQQKKDVMKNKKLDHELEVRERRNQGRENLSFNGPLKTQKLPALRDLAWVLRLSEDGSRNDLITRISTFFDTEGNKHFREDAQYIGLFHTRRAQKRRHDDIPGLDETENGAQLERPQQRRRFGNDVTNSSPILPSDEIENGAQRERPRQHGRRFGNDITNSSPVLPSDDHEQDEDLFQFDGDEELEGAQLPHAPGDWGMYHTPEALYLPQSLSESVPGPSTRLWHPGPPPLNQDQRSILSFMNHPSFVRPQPGSNSYYYRPMFR